MKNVFAKLLNFFNNSKALELSPSEKEKLENLSKKLKLKINNPLFFAKALTHRSYIEKGTLLHKSNERLEFLGDAVLGLVVAEVLFKNFTNGDEGYLTKTRSHIVDKNSLFDAASEFGLKEFLLYDKRFIKDNEVGIKSILADCMEAIIGAIYLDQGIGDAKKFILKWIINPNLESGKYQIDNNYKGQLLEFTHSKKISAPEYVLLSAEGPDHKKEFLVEVTIDEKSFGKGRGTNKKSAEQEAAMNALSKLKNS